ncbi:U32 family peptidase, partial [Enterococcus faecalis]|uniref:U32 family peptidase n=1 Tax=Enterococcus faecalis TaxID=1351 RepID=UPI003CCC6314
SYSGRCTLSNHMSMRDANRGGFSQSFCWEYGLFDKPFWAERRGKNNGGGGEEEVSIRGGGKSMVGHISELI